MRLQRDVLIARVQLLEDQCSKEHKTHAPVLGVWPMQKENQDTARFAEAQGSEMQETVSQDCAARQVKDENESARRLAQGLARNDDKPLKCVKGGSYEILELRRRNLALEMEVCLVLCWWCGLSFQFIGCQISDFATVYSQQMRA